MTTTMTTEISEYDDSKFRKIKRFRSESESPSQTGKQLSVYYSQEDFNVQLPNSIAQADSPANLVYSIFTNDKILYTKQELLLIIHKLHCMLKTTFATDCSYIS